MMLASKKYFIIGLVLFVVFSAFELKKTNQWSAESNVYDVLFDLGEPLPKHYMKDLDSTLIERGKELVLDGKSKGSRYISKHYVCTSCHNTVREDPDASISEPDSRLAYAVSNNIPYLQGSTFWGIVNREKWYNDDYVKKYGDLVVKASGSIRESVQLCAKVCSAGRTLKEDELDAVMAYLWSLQLKLRDLNLSPSEMSSLNNEPQDDKKAEEMRLLLKSKYQLNSPATFAEAPTDKINGYGLTGRPEIGADIFRLSCQHCHRPHGESDVVFEDSKKTFKWFKRHFKDKGRLSIYNIIRYGTYSESGHPEYMPLYTLEKMSHQQVEDLKAYMVSKTK